MATKSLTASKFHDFADHYQEWILKDAESRTTEVWDAMKGFYDDYTKLVEQDEEPSKESQRQWGRLYLRFRMCEILMRACAWPPYDFDEPTAALVNWKDNQWTELIDLLSEIEKQCDTAKHFTKIITACKLHRALTVIRSGLERGMQESGRKQVRVKKRRMEKLLEACRNGGLDVQARTDDLFAQSDEEKPADALPELLPVKDLKRIFESKVFSFIKFQTRVERLIFRWNYFLFENEEAELWSVGYNLPRCFRDSEQADVEQIDNAEAPRSRSPLKEPNNEKADVHNVRVLSLTKPRAALQLTPCKRNHLPRQTARRDSPYWTEEGASRKKRSRSPARKSASSRRRLDSSFNAASPTSICPTPEAAQLSPSTDTSPARGAVALGEIPARVNTVIRSGREPDKGRFSHDGRHVRRRIMWTIEEERALRAGIKKFGVGEWAKIKDYYEDTFRNRTSVMLKDKYRNMLKTQTIEDDV